MPDDLEVYDPETGSRIGGPKPSGDIARGEGSRHIAVSSRDLTPAEGLAAWKELYGVRTGKSPDEVDAFVELIRRA